MVEQAVATYVESHGEGPPTILVHGFTGDTLTMLDLAGRLAGRRILLDLIGHGRSEAPDRTAYTIDDAVAQLAAVAAGLGEPPVLLGYSMGARVVLAAAVGGVLSRGLVLIGGRAGISDEQPRRLRRYSDDELADDIEENGIAWFVEHWASQPFFSTQHALGEEHLQVARRQRLGNAPRALAASLRGMGPGAQRPLHDRLGEVTVPALLVVGSLDEPFRRHGEELLAGLPDARLEVIESAGHAAHVEQPVATATVINEFLEMV